MPFWQMLCAMILPIVTKISDKQVSEFDFGRSFEESPSNKLKAGSEMICSKNNVQNCLSSPPAAIPGSLSNTILIGTVGSNEGFL